MTAFKNSWFICSSSLLLVNKKFIVKPELHHMPRSDVAGGFGVVMFLICLTSECGFVLLVWIERLESWNVCGLLCNAIVSFVNWLDWCVALLMVGSMRCGLVWSALRWGIVSEWFVCICAFLVWFDEWQ